MKQVPKKILASLFVIAVIYVAYHIAFPTVTWRYRMTVTVETPEGIRSGSAVREMIKGGEISIIPGQGGVSHWLKEGEAVVVDLGPRGLLFALMQNVNGGPDYGRSVAIDAFPLGEKTPLGTKVTIRERLSYPRLVHFKDINDPLTVEDVTVSRAGVFKTYRLEEIFGEGVKLKEITIETTDDPVTHDIEKILPWLHTKENLRGHITGFDLVCCK